MNIIDILYVRYFKEDGSSMSIGGIQSYITQLSKLATSMGYKVRVFQFGTHDFYRQTDIADVYAILKQGNQNGNLLIQKAAELHNKNDRWLTIIANDTLIPSFYVPNSIYSALRTGRLNVNLTADQM